MTSNAPIDNPSDDLQARLLKHADEHASEAEEDGDEWTLYGRREARLAQDLREAANRLARTNTCKTCKHWHLGEENRYNSEANAAKWGHRVRRCKHPRLLFYQRPDKDAAAVCDGSQYQAELITGEEFGCVLHESADE